MSENRGELMEGQMDRRFGKRCRPLAALLAVGIFGAGAALAIDNLPPQAPGPAACAWGALKGGLATPPKFVLAFDGDFNVQGFYGPGGGVPKSSPTDKAPDAMVELTKFGSATIYCYKIDGKRECVEG